MNILEEIVAHKKIEVEKSKERFPLEKLKNQVGATGQSPLQKRNFCQAIKDKIYKKQIALIAEIKKASPSCGVIKDVFDPQEIARSYANGGASCLSVLTDEKYFQGTLNYIEKVKDVVSLPVLRKDFIIDSYQVYESIYYQADCILLIVSALDKDMLRRLFELACESKIDSLIEVHDERELEITLDIGENSQSLLIGINNRDLKTFETNLDTTKKLVTKYKRDLSGKVVVSESGIFTGQDIRLLIDLGVYTFLVGEALMKENDIERATKELIAVKSNLR